MRNIEFRGWSKELQRWLVGDLHHRKESGKDVAVIYSEHRGVPYEVIPESVGEYLDYRDCDGDRMCEGDIVTITDQFDHQYTGMVVFIYKEFCIRLRDDHKVGRTYFPIQEYGKFRDMGAEITLSYKYKIIGNVHENPELMIQDSGRYKENKVLYY